MKLIIVRHAEPDYAVDSLTEKGFREAELLSDRLARLPITKIYCSPLGRARDTAAPTLRKTGLTAENCDWLAEFPSAAVDPQTGGKRRPWDLLPAVWTAEDALFSKEDWLHSPYWGSDEVAEKYRDVCRGLDELLARHGYERNGYIYSAVKPNTDTVVLFCHFGVGCVLLSHLLNCSPVLLWQGLVALPSSVTTLNTEEREESVASFRCSGYGDLSHLYAAGEPASFAARFCEVYTNKDERH